MPGALAHITAINLVLTPDVLSNISEMPSEAKHILLAYLPYAELGALSPDYPYASDSDEQNRWADIMHYENVDELVRSLVYRVQMLPAGHKEKCFAWLAGFITHLVTEYTIRPAIEHHIGLYHENEREYQVCEMNQDTYIRQRLGCSHDVFAERLKQKIACCSDLNDRELLDSSVRNLWSIALTEVYSGYANRCLPAINLWHTSYLNNMATAMAEDTLFPLFKCHSNGLDYHGFSPDDIDYKYINQLHTPKGKVNYDVLFDQALANVIYYLTKLSLSVFNHRNDQLFTNRNNDIGLKHAASFAV